MRFFYFSCDLDFYGLELAFRLYLLKFSTIFAGRLVRSFIVSVNLFLCSPIVLHEYYITPEEGKTIFMVKI